MYNGCIGPGFTGETVAHLRHSPASAPATDNPAILTQYWRICAAMTSGVICTGIVLPSEPQFLKEMIMKFGSLMAVAGFAVATALSSLAPALAADAPKHAAPAHPAAKKHFTKVGLLACKSQGGFGYIIGSSTDLDCTFENARGGKLYEYYNGTITKVGPDIGFKTRETLLWAVYAPSFQVPGGRLDGTYVGVSASVGLGLGFGANVLAGNLKNNLNLVPLSVSGSVGLNAAAGIGALTLNSASASR